jgi:PIN domain nuclease of toxin-antitoxin system
VLDASVILAVVLEEAGAENIYPLMEAGLISAVNVAEVVARLQDYGIADEAIDIGLAELCLNIVPFDGGHAMIAGKLRAGTRKAGLSLGDRACLALAIAEEAVAVTMDRAWAKLDLPVQVQLAR